MVDVQTRYLVVDLEATCDDGALVPRHEMEVIEIGAVIVEAPFEHVLAEFQLFVKPEIHPNLTAFCSQLTSIQQDDVNHAVDFAAACEVLRDWQTPFAPDIFASWGDFDRKLMKRQCAAIGLDVPLPRKHLNIKAQFSRALAIKRQFGMALALKKLGLELSGRHHRGLDDARNIARILPYALQTPGFALPDHKQGRLTL